MANTKQIKRVLRSLKPYPLLGIDYQESDFISISLSGCGDEDLSTNTGLTKCIQLQLKAANAKMGYGGYLENRTIYQRSEHFQKKEGARNIHLGVDIWATAGTPIYAPIAGNVHSWADNNIPGDYGATIILLHDLNGVQFHTLYGHISRTDLKNLEDGMKVQKGQMFCQIGDEQDNGGWVPHLHFQIIIDMQGMKGDFPGVASKSDIDLYKENCPDPALLITCT